MELMKSISEIFQKIISQLSLLQKIIGLALIIGLVIIVLIVQSQTGLRRSFKQEANNFLIPFKKIMTDLWPYYDLPQTYAAHNGLNQMKESLNNLKEMAKSKEEKQMSAVCEDIYTKLQDLYRDAETPELKGTGVIIRVEFLHLYDESFDLF